MSEVISWSLKLAKSAPKSERIQHFRTLGEVAKQTKVFFASSMVFILRFEQGECVSFKSRQRRRNESLLGLEGSIEEQLRKEGVI